MEQKLVNSYIGIGSNLGNSNQLVQSACDELAQLAATTVIKISRFYKNPPMGPLNQNDFINAVVALETSLSAENLLQQLQMIELRHGRARHEGERWGPRTLDLDILIYGNETIQLDHLQIPHYDLKNRYFMLYPLVEIAPNITLPNGEAINDLLQQCPKTKLEAL